MGVKVREKVKGSGVWWVFVNHRSQRTSRQVGSHKAAQKVKEMIEARLKLGKSLLPEEKPIAPELRDYYERFKKNYLQTAVKDSTRGTYETCFDVHILPALGDRCLDTIGRAEVKDFIASLVEKKLARASIGTIARNLCTFLNHAKEDGLIQANPAARTGKYYKQAHVVHQEIEPLTHEEVPLFLGSVLQNDPPYYPLFLCAIHTGLRSGELVGLQWGDIDFNGKFLTVCRSVVRRRIGSPKNGKTRRVDLSDALLFTFSDLRRRRKEEWLTKGKTEIPEWVFCNEDGGWGRDSGGSDSTTSGTRSLPCSSKTGSRCSTSRNRWDTPASRSRWTFTGTWSRGRTTPSPGT